VYKTAPSDQLDALRGTQSKLTTARFASLPKSSANRAFVFSPNTTVRNRGGIRLVISSLQCRRRVVAQGFLPCNVSKAILLPPVRNLIPVLQSL